jgi:pilus assembly protein CpaB
MRRGPFMMLVAAFLCAAAAAVLARSWMANQGGEVAAVKQETVIPTAAVIVAARDLKPGDKLTADALKEIQWPAASMPKGTYSNKDAVLKAAGTHGLYTKVWANQPLLAQQLSLEGQDGMLADRLDGDLKGVSIRVNDVAGVSGFVQPEDRVDVLLTTTAAAQPANETSALPAAAANAATRTILRNVRVLASARPRPSRRRR